MWRRHRSRREDSKYLNRSLAGSTFRQVSRDNSSSNPPAGPRTPRSHSSSWRKEAMTNSVRSNKTLSSAQDCASSPGNLSSLGERHPLCMHHSSGYLPADDPILHHSPSTGSVSSEGGSQATSSEPGGKRAGDSAGRGGTLLVGRRVGNGTTGAVPATIFLFDVSRGDSSEETTPLKSSRENLSASTSLTRNCVGGEAEP